MCLFVTPFHKHFFSLKFFVSLLLSFFLFSCAGLERVNSSKHDKPIEKNKMLENNQELVYRSDKDFSSSSSPVLSPAVEALSQQAAAQQAAGQIESAIATIERALRIAPQTPQLHLSLAQLRLKQNQAHAALQLALKGQSLLGANDKSLSKDFWKMIGDCYVRLGNSAQASQAYSHL